MEEVTTLVAAPVANEVMVAVLDNIDKLVEWHKTTAAKQENAGMKLAKLIAHASETAAWSLRAKSESQYAENIFPGAVSQYWAMRQVGLVSKLYPVERECVGFSKWRSLCRIQEKFGHIEDEWFAQAEEMRRDDFVKLVTETVGSSKKALPAPDKDMLSTFKVFPSTRPLFHKALETAKLEAGSENPSNALANIMADYLSGHTDKGLRVNDCSTQINLACDAIRRLKHCKDFCEETIGVLSGEVMAAIESLRPE